MNRWKKLHESEETVGYRHNVSRHYALPDGKVKGFDSTEVGHTVSIFALTRKNEVVLVKQFRPGPEWVLLELPCGHVDDGETWLDAAERELLEETGYKGDLRYLSTQYMGAYIQGWKHIFLATNCEEVKAQATDEDEFIEVVLMPLSEFREHLYDWDSCETGAAYQALDALEKL